MCSSPTRPRGMDSHTPDGRFDRPIERMERKITGCVSCKRSIYAEEKYDICQQCKDTFSKFAEGLNEILTKLGEMNDKGRESQNNGRDS